MTSIIPSPLLSAGGSSAFSVLSSGCWVSCLRAQTQGLSSSSYTYRRHFRVHASLFPYHECSWGGKFRSLPNFRWGFQIKFNDTRKYFLYFHGLKLVKCYETVAMHSGDDKVFHGKVKMFIHVLKSTYKMIPFPGFAGMVLGSFH